MIVDPNEDEQLEKSDCNIKCYRILDRYIECYRILDQRSEREWSIGFEYMKVEW